MHRLAADARPVVAPSHVQADPGHAAAVRGAGQLPGPQVPAQQRRGAAPGGGAFDPSAGALRRTYGTQDWLEGVGRRRCTDFGGSEKKILK